MISKTKPQNFIVVVTLILGLVSGIGLASTASYYSGSYVIVSYLQIDLDEVRVANVDPTNTSINPSIALDFSFVAPETSDGEATVTYLVATVYINGDKMNYASFRKNIPSASRAITSGYNKLFTVSSSIIEMEDKNVLYNASADGDWTFSITLTVFYHVFNSPAESVRIIPFSYEGNW